MAQIKLKGAPVKTNGELPKVGAKAPEVRGVDTELKSKSLADFAGKKKIICFVPSLDTPVCSMSAKKFSEAAKKRDDVALIYVSADLPFALKRSCMFDNVTPLSLVRSKKSAEDYGVLIQDGPLEGLCARAVVVVDEHGKVLFSELVKEITTEPDYGQVWESLE
jgi:thioredoxin-dependent peroxiredoxin